MTTDSTMAISDLPQDLVEEIIFRVPLTSSRAVRTTCKNWNSLFAKKHIRKSRAAMKKKEFLAVMMMDCSLYLTSVNLRGIHKNVESFINQKGKLINLNGVDVSSVFHCSGLLLCTTSEKESRLVVLNPYRGDTKWIKPTDHGWDMNMYALGYEKNNKKKKKSRRSHKILIGNMEFREVVESGCRQRSCNYKIYNFNSGTWKDITPGGDMKFHERGVSLKGNTFWLARGHTKYFRHWVTERDPGRGIRRCCIGRKPYVSRKYYWTERRVIPPEFSLLCFDFTTERFGPCLPLPFHSSNGDRVSPLSSVRDEKLAVLYQRCETSRINIWITDNVEPTTVSWSKFLAVEMTPVTCYELIHRTFLVDEKKKVAVIFEKMPSHVASYIIGEDGYFKKLDLGEPTNQCPQLVCSYVPSSVKIK